MEGISVNFYAEDGSPLVVNCNLGSGVSFAFDLNAGFTQAIRFTSSGPQLTGYIVVYYPQFALIRATEVFRYEPGGTVLAEVGVPEISADTNFSCPAVMNSAEGVFTVVSLANAPDEFGVSRAQSAVLNLIRSDGILKKSVRVDLAAGEHKSLYLNDPNLFGEVGDFTGSLSISSAYPIGALAMRQDKQAFGAISINSGPILPPFAVTGLATPEIEPNDLFSQAQTISGNTLVSGVIATPYDTDIYQFSGKKGDIISVVARVQVFNSDQDPDPQIYLLGFGMGFAIGSYQKGLYGQSDYFLQLARFSHR
jgi:hypothetical protein